MIDQRFSSASVFPSWSTPPLFATSFLLLLLARALADFLPSLVFFSFRIYGPCLSLMEKTEIRNIRDL